MVYVWIAYPLFCKAMSKLSEREANTAFAITVGAFAAACVSFCRNMVTFHGHFYYHTNKMLKFERG